MKIKTKTPSIFYSITIIIETEKEAKKLWHILNCPVGIALTEYINKKDSISINDLREFNINFFKEFNKKFKPEND